MLKSYSKRGKKQVESTFKAKFVLLVFLCLESVWVGTNSPYSKPLNGYRKSESILMAIPPTSMATAKFAAVMTAAVFHPKSFAITVTVARHGM